MKPSNLRYLLNRDFRPGFELKKEAILSSYPATMITISSRLPFTVHPRISEKPHPLSLFVTVITANLTTVPSLGELNIRHYNRVCVQIGNGGSTPYEAGGSLTAEVVKLDKFRWYLPLTVFLSTFDYDVNISSRATLRGTPGSLVLGCREGSW